MEEERVVVDSWSQVDAPAPEEPKPQHAKAALVS